MGTRRVSEIPLLRGRNRWSQPRRVTTLTIIVACLILLLAVIPPGRGLLPQISFEEDDRLLYLLSGGGQALAAVAALVFALSLFVPQLASGYSLEIAAVGFDKSTIRYMAVVLLGIVLPFVALAWESIVLAYLSIWLDGLCVALVLPYVLHVKDSSSIEVLLDSCVESACKEARKDGAQSPPSLPRIEGVILAAIRIDDKRVFERALRAVLLISLYCREFVKEDSDELWKGLQRTVLRTVDRCLNSESFAREIVTSYENAMDHAAGSGWDDGLASLVWEMALAVDIGPPDVGSTLVDGAVRLMMRVGEGLAFTAREWLKSIQAILEMLSVLSTSPLSQIDRFATTPAKGTYPTAAVRAIEAVGSLSMMYLEAGAEVGEPSRWVWRLAREAREGWPGDDRRECSAAYSLVQLGGWALENSEDMLFTRCADTFARVGTSPNEDLVRSWAPVKPLFRRVGDEEKEKASEERARRFVKEFEIRRGLGGVNP